MENRVANILSRIVALEERFNSRPSDVAEQRRRDELIRYATVPPTSQCSFPLSNLEAIEEQLRPLSGKQEPPRLDDRVQVSEDVSQLLEDLQEAIFDYQVRSRSQT